MNEILEQGMQAQTFVQHPFFQKWLAHASKLADERLRELKMCQSSDGAVLKSLQMRWRITEEILELMQTYPYSCIKDAEQEQKALESVERAKLIEQLGR